MRLPKLPFGNGRSVRGRGRHRKKRTQPLRAVQHMKAWLKSQAVMLYGVEHDELWVHKGFCEVSVSMGSAAQAVLHTACQLSFLISLLAAHARNAS